MDDAPSYSSTSVVAAVAAGVAHESSVDVHHGRSRFMNSSSRVKRSFRVVLRQYYEQYRVHIICTSYCCCCRCCCTQYFSIYMIRVCSCCSATCIQSTACCCCCCVLLYCCRYLLLLAAAVHRRTPATRLVLPTYIPSMFMFISNKRTSSSITPLGSTVASVRPPTCIF